MYAIVDIAGQQFKVEKDQKLYVHRLEGDEGKKVSFDKVLLIDTGSKVSVGDPVVKGAAVAAKIVTHLKGDKVLVFKKKRRKGYQKLNGHRQYLTQIQIESISETGAVTSKPTAAKEKTESAKAENVKAKTAATKKKTAATKKEAETKASATKKPTSAKTTSAAKTSSATKTGAKKPAAARKPAPKKDEDK